MQVFGVVGWKNNGKTTLVERLVGHLTGSGTACRPSSTPIMRSISTSPARTAGATARPAPGSSARHGAPLGGDPRAARGSRAAARRPARADDAGGSGPRRRLQALLAPQAGGASARARHSAARRRGHLDRGRSRATSRCPTCGLPQFGLDDVPAIADFVLRAGSILAAAMTRPCPGLLRLSAATASPWARRMRLLRERIAPVVGQRAGRPGRGRGPLPRRAADQSSATCPAFDNAAVDGFAFAFAEGIGAGRARVCARLAGRAAAGHPLPDELPPGLGAPRAHRGGDARGRRHRGPAGRVPRLETDAVAIPPGLKRGANRRRAGEDVRAGETVLQPGTGCGRRRSASPPSWAAPSLAVFEPLRVAMLSTGDELVEPGASSSAGRVFDANRPILRALLQTLPVEVTDLGIVRDEPAQVRPTLERRGRAPSGRAHLRRGVARRRGPCRPRPSAARGRLDFWQIAMKPGRPLAFGRLGEAVFIGLPGNPVATMVCFLLFARPVLLRLGGFAWRAPTALPVPAGVRADQAGRPQRIPARARS